MEFKKRRFPKLSITEKEISGTYKGKYFNIFLYEKGDTYFKKGEKRYNIDVTDIESGLYDVNTWEECENIEEALKVAIKGAML